MPGLQDPFPRILNLNPQVHQLAPSIAGHSRTDMGTEWQWKT